jgi:hypothetical protein
MFLDISGTLVSNATIQIPAANKFYCVRNATSGAFTVTIKTSGGTGVEITQGDEAVVYCDGTDTHFQAMPFFTVSAFARTYLDDADAAATRTTLGVFEDPVTTRGDIIVGDSGGSSSRLALPAEGQMVLSDGTDTVWAEPLTRSFNMLLNGAFRAHQEHPAAGFTGVGADAIKYTLDEWVVHTEGSPQARATVRIFPTSGASFDGQGFPAYAQIDCTTAEGAVAATELWSWETSIIGENLASLRYGSANARTVTLQFWVRSPKTGTHCVAVYLPGIDKHYIREFTVTSANTDEHKIVTFPGLTADAITGDKAERFRVAWPLVAGSNFQASANVWASGEDYATSNQQNLLDNVANNFEVTGLKMELGSIATPYVHMEWQDDLRRCQYFFQKTYEANVIPGTANTRGNLVGYPNTSAAGAGSVNMNWQFPTELRLDPTDLPSGTAYNPNNGNSGEMNRGGTGVSAIIQEIGGHGARITNDVSTTVDGFHNVHGVVNSRMRE